MPSEPARQFERVLNKLFAERTHWLRALVRKPSPGRPPTFDRRKVRRRITQLQGHAERAIVKKFFRREFGQLNDSGRRHSWRPRGRRLRGIPAKKAAFRRFWERKVDTRTYIYAFWKDGTCRYIGRTGASRFRPTAHFKKRWFRSVTRVDVYHFPPASALPKIECLAAHSFQPTENKARPAKRKWSKKCPICKVRREIRREVKRIFRLH